MITLTHIADTHLGHRQYGLKQREDDMISTLGSALQEMIEERDTDVILLPGDLFHSRDLRPKVLHQTEQELAKVPDDIPVLVSRGNHDENLTPRDVTWLNYLHQRGLIVFLKAELSADPDTAWFNPYEPQNPGNSSGFYDIDVSGLDGPIRIFGLQWRGARAGQALEKVAKGIKETNDMHGEPAFTILLTHFGIEDEVPTLGGTLTHSELRDVKEHVDYLALGHIHKKYEAADWIYNPGSPEAHNTREGRDEWDHGYFEISLDNDGTLPKGDSVDFEIEHHNTKRRPYYRIDFDVTPYETPGELETAFREHVKEEESEIVEYCSRDIYTVKGEKRDPIIDLRFTGTLQFSRGDFQTDELARWVEELTDVLYVQVNAGFRTADVQELISDIDEEEVFQDGKLNTSVLEDRVFETIAKESMYAEKAMEVADILSTAHQMAQSEEAVEDIQESVSSSRRELFPELTDDVVVDVEENPFGVDEINSDKDSSKENDERINTDADTEGGDV